MAASPVRRQIPLAFAFVLQILPLFMRFIVDCHFSVLGFGFFLHCIKRGSLFYFYQKRCYSLKMQN